MHPSQCCTWLGRHESALPRLRQKCVQVHLEFTEACSSKKSITNCLELSWLDLCLQNTVQLTETIMQFPQSIQGVFQSAIAGVQPSGLLFGHICCPFARSSQGTSKSCQLGSFAQCLRFFIYRKMNPRSADRKNLSLTQISAPPLPPPSARTC